VTDFGFRSHRLRLENSGVTNSGQSSFHGGVSLWGIFLGRILGWILGWIFGIMFDFMKQQPAKERKKYFRLDVEEWELVRTFVHDYFRQSSQCYIQNNVSRLNSSPGQRLVNSILRPAQGTLLMMIFNREIMQPLQHTQFGLDILVSSS
jgi:hypothetical protein